MNVNLIRLIYPTYNIQLYFMREKMNKFNYEGDKIRIILF
jgi:hypothetical protein